MHIWPPVEPGEPQRVTMYATRLAYVTATCRVSILCNIGLLIVICAVLLWTRSVYVSSLRRPPTARSATSRLPAKTRSESGMLRP